jgi:hypothetical protein
VSRIPNFPLVELPITDQCVECLEHSTTSELHRHRADRRLHDRVRPNDRETC